MEDAIYKLPMHCSVQEEALYIALAGQHQIWRHILSSGATGVFSGDGAERSSNGSSGPRSSWAQPSGLSLSSSGAELIVADSESSCIRSMALQNGSSQVGLALLVSLFVCLHPPSRTQTC